MSDAYFPTGNEFLSLPTLRAKDGAIEDLSVLHMGLNGLLSFSGGSTPFFTPRVMVDDEEVFLADRLVWSREADWLPRFFMKEGSLELEGLYFCPPGERGFVFSLKVTNTSDKTLYCGLAAELQWAALNHTIQVAKELRGDRVLVAKGVGLVPAMEFRTPAPILALAPYPPDSGSRFFFRKGLAPLNPATREVRVEEKESLTLHWLQSREVKPGEFWECFFFIGVGLDESGALSAGQEMSRTGGKALKVKTLDWLAKRHKKSKDPALESRMNLNFVFNRFFASGLTLDTEEAVAVRSRSTRFKGGGDYADRDALLWTFPAMLAFDPEWAKELLGSLFKRQGSNFGAPRRYLSGSVLEPGFELEGLCAPILALRSYVESTKDLAFLNRPEVRQSLERFEKELAAQKHSKKNLYMSWLSPSQDLWNKRYGTFDNVLAWKALLDLAFLYRLEQNRMKAYKLQGLANLLKTAIIRLEGMKGLKGRQFAWSVDLNVKGSQRPFDDPRRSLLLLPHYGFCPTRSPLWKKTRDWVYSPENPAAILATNFEGASLSPSRKPFLASALNNLLAGQKEKALDFLKRTSLDNGVACESVDPDTGDGAEKPAYGALAGYLAWSLWQVMGKKPKIKVRR